MSEYPEHDKLRAIKQEKQIVINFLEWLEENNYAVFVLDSKGNCDRDCTIKELLAAHFEIDEDKLEEEKQRMISEMVKSNER
jgi:hypothetical protein